MIANSALKNYSDLGLLEVTENSESTLKNSELDKTKNIGKDWNDYGLLYKKNNFDGMKICY